ncbi:MAG: hypothetical protein HYU37_15700 [Acidobacteria bacterium]|nr:hypothetical protein [Acidobacteriota bacterium]
MRVAPEEDGGGDRTGHGHRDESCDRELKGLGLHHAEHPASVDARQCGPGAEAGEPHQRECRKEDAAADLQRAAREDEGRERKRRRQQRGNRQRHRAAGAHPLSKPLEAPHGRESMEPRLARLVADPERHGGAGERPGRGQQRVQPEQPLIAGGEVDHQRINPEGHEEHHRGIERAQQQRAPPREKDIERRYQQIPS